MTAPLTEAEAGAVVVERYSVDREALDATGRHTATLTDHDALVWVAKQSRALADDLCTIANRRDGELTTAAGKAVAARLAEAEAGAALFGWLAEAKCYRRSVVSTVDREMGGYRVTLFDGRAICGDNFSGATRAEALMAAARWVAEGKGGER